MGEPRKITPASRILIVDDHPMVRRGLRAAVEGEPDLSVCGEADSAASALALVDGQLPDIAIVDISLRRDNGLHLIRDLRARHPRIRIIALSMHEDSLYAERALRAGALAYVSKTASTDVLLMAVRKALHDEMTVDPGVLDHLVRRVVAGEDNGEEDPVRTLSDRELQIFELLGRGSTVKEIADRLRISQKTVETHRQHVKTKLRVGSSTELVRRATLWTEGNR